MRAVQVTIDIDHLRFNPEAEPHPHRRDFTGETADAVRYFFAIYNPVAQRGSRRISLAEPAVIEYEKLDTEICGLFCHGKDLLFIKVKIRRLPVIQQYRPLFVAPVAPRQPLPVKRMKRPAHTAKPLIGIHQDGFRRVEKFTGPQRP